MKTLFLKGMSFQKDQGEMMMSDDESEPHVETLIYTIHAILISLLFIPSFMP